MSRESLGEHHCIGSRLINFVLHFLCIYVCVYVFIIIMIMDNIIPILKNAQGLIRPSSIVDITSEALLSCGRTKP